MRFKAKDHNDDNFSDDDICSEEETEISWWVGNFELRLSREKGWKCLICVKGIYLNHAFVLYTILHPHQLGWIDIELETIPSPPGLLRCSLGPPMATKASLGLDLCCSLAWELQQSGKSSLTSAHFWLGTPPVNLGFPPRLHLTSLSRAQVKLLLKSTPLTTSSQSQPTQGVQHTHKAQLTASVLSKSYALNFPFLDTHVSLAPTHVCLSVRP